MIKAIYILLIIAIVSGVGSVLYVRFANDQVEDTAVMCTMDAQQCPDGSFVGRSGPNCEFVCPEVSEPTEQVSVQYMIDTLAELIAVDTITPGSLIESGMEVTGKARGGWYFEASFPVMVVSGDGRIIGESVATAQGDWMTSDFVPFTTTLNFASPYTPGDPEFMKRGKLIFQKDNPSGLPENDNSLEIPITFAP